jgi:hypothetical protein
MFDVLFCCPIRCLSISAPRMVGALLFARCNAHWLCALRFDAPTYPFLAYALLAFELHMAAGHLLACNLPGGTAEAWFATGHAGGGGEVFARNGSSLLDKLDRNLVSAACDV